MSGTGRIPLMIQESSEADLFQAPHEAGKGALLRLAVGADAQQSASAWLVTRNVVGAPGPWSRHAVFCACCQGQNPLIAALHQLFFDRVRGLCPLFTFAAISCAPDQKSRVRQMLEQDVLVRARYEF